MSSTFNREAHWSMWCMYCSKLGVQGYSMRDQNRLGIYHYIYILVMSFRVTPWHCPFVYTNPSDLKKVVLRSCKKVWLIRSPFSVDFGTIKDILLHRDIIFIFPWKIQDQNLQMFKFKIFLTQNEPTSTHLHSRPHLMRRPENYLL